MSKSLVYRRLRAPRGDQSMLIEPSWQACIKLATANAQLLAAYDFDLHGRSFQSLRMSTRQKLLAKAIEYSTSYLPNALGDNPTKLASATTPDADDPFIVSGHQPTLFHPGVWAKNFAIDRLASAVNGRAVQLVIDNDLMRNHSILCPAGSTNEPTRATEAFDRYHDAIPYEMRFVQDRKLFESFAGRVSRRIEPFVKAPLVNAFWEDACSALDTGLPIGHAFAQARHRLEHRWGLNTIELPLSHLCETEEFRWFAAHLFLRADEVRRAYNNRLQEYRDVHRLRNHAQPLPNLQMQERWVETPFWVWTTDAPTRRAAWICESEQDLVISDRNGNSWRLENAQANPSYIEEQMAVHSSKGLRLRPRALSNTMFLRLFCADTFVHGIGGAKYDQVTDLIIHDLFGVAPPTFGVLSLTALLPSPHPLLGLREIIHKRVQIRDMYFHPERFLVGDIRKNDQVSSKVKTKENLIREKPATGSAAAWHQSVERVNANLREYLQEKTDREKKNLLHLIDQAKSSEIFSSREWPFCLFEEDFLRTRLLDLNYETSYSSGAE